MGPKWAAWEEVGRPRWLTDRKGQPALHLPGGDAYPYLAIWCLGGVSSARHFRGADGAMAFPADVQEPGAG